MAVIRVDGMRNWQDHHRQTTIHSLHQLIRLLCAEAAAKEAGLSGALCRSRPDITSHCSYSVIIVAR